MATALVLSAGEVRAALASAGATSEVALPALRPEAPLAGRGNADAVQGASLGALT